MKIQRAVGTVTVVLAVVSLACLAAYFLALHDIPHDYASPQMLSEQGYPSRGRYWHTGAFLADAGSDTLT